MQLGKSSWLATGLLVCVLGTLETTVSAVTVVSTFPLSTSTRAFTEGVFSDGLFPARFQFSCASTRRFALDVLGISDGTFSSGSVATGWVSGATTNNIGSMTTFDDTTDVSMAVRVVLVSADGSGEPVRVGYPAGICVFTGNEGTVVTSPAGVVTVDIADLRWNAAPLLTWRPLPQRSVSGRFGASVVVDCTPIGTDATVDLSRFDIFDVFTQADARSSAVGAFYTWTDGPMALIHVWIDPTCNDFARIAVLPRFCSVPGTGAFSSRAQIDIRPDEISASMLHPIVYLLFPDDPTKSRIVIDCTGCGMHMFGKLKDGRDWSPVTSSVAKIRGSSLGGEGYQWEAVPGGWTNPYSYLDPYNNREVLLHPPQILDVRVRPLDGFEGPARIVVADSVCICEYAGATWANSQVFPSVGTWLDAPYPADTSSATSTPTISLTPSPTPMCGGQCSFTSTASSSVTSSTSKSMTSTTSPSPSPTPTSTPSHTPTPTPTRSTTNTRTASISVSPSPSMQDGNLVDVGVVHTQVPAGEPDGRLCREITVDCSSIVPVGTSVDDGTVVFDHGWTARGIDTSELVVDLDIAPGTPPWFTAEYPSRRLIVCQPVGGLTASSKVEVPWDFCMFEHTDGSGSVSTRATTVQFTSAAMFSATASRTRTASVTPTPSPREDLWCGGTVSRWSLSSFRGSGVRYTCPGGGVRTGGDTCIWDRNDCWMPNDRTEFVLGCMSTPLLGSCEAGVELVFSADHGGLVCLDTDPGAVETCDTAASFVVTGAFRTTGLRTGPSASTTPSPSASPIHQILKYNNPNVYNGCSFHMNFAPLREGYSTRWCPSVGGYKTAGSMGSHGRCILPASVVSEAECGATDLYLGCAPPGPVPPTGLSTLLDPSVLCGDAEIGHTATWYSGQVVVLGGTNSTGHPVVRCLLHGTVGMGTSECTPEDRLLVPPTSQIPDRGDFRPSYSQLPNRATCVLENDAVAPSISHTVPLPTDNICPKAVYLGCFEVGCESATHIHPTAGSGCFNATETEDGCLRNTLAALTCVEASGTDCPRVQGVYSNN